MSISTTKDANERRVLGVDDLTDEELALVIEAAYPPGYDHLEHELGQRAPAGQDPTS